MARRTEVLMWNKYLPEDMGIYVAFHPEYGGDVYQPNIDGVDTFIEPYTTQKEAYAFLKGFQFGKEEWQE